MDKLATYRQLIQQLLSEYASYRPSYGEVEAYTLFDTAHDRYQVLSAGWHGDERIYGCSIHMDIKDGKICTGWDFFDYCCYFV